MQLSFPVFVMALMSFVGWILFVFFGGLGVVGIPIDNFRVRERLCFIIALRYCASCLVLVVLYCALAVLHVCCALAAM